jgi:hypothetical protein
MHFQEVLVVDSRLRQLEPATAGLEMLKQDPGSEIPENPKTKILVALDNYDMTIFLGNIRTKSESIGLISNHCPI